MADLTFCHKPFCGKDLITRKIDFRQLAVLALANGFLILGVEGHPLPLFDDAAVRQRLLQFFNAGIRRFGVAEL